MFNIESKHTYFWITSEFKTKDLKCILLIDYNNQLFKEENQTILKTYTHIQNTLTHMYKKQKAKHLNTCLRFYSKNSGNQENNVYIYFKKKERVKKKSRKNR